MENLVLRPSDNSRIIDLEGKNYNTISFRGAGIRDIKLINGMCRRMVIGDFPKTEMSFKTDYLSFLDDTAPKHISLKGIRFIPDRKTNGAIYTRPGVNNLLVDDCRFDGESQSISIYLNSECHDITIQNNKFRNKTGREHIAIDGARNVLIEQNIAYSDRGFVYIFRNCGEGGRNRWTQPNNCVIQKNVIHVSSIFHPAIMLNSRPERRCYCIDRNNGIKIPGTSSTNWRSMPVNNKVIDNSIVGGTPCQHIFPSAYKNEISGNFDVESSKQPVYGLKHKLVEQAKIQAFKYYCMFGGK